MTAGTGSSGTGSSGSTAGTGSSGAGSSGLTAGIGSPGMIAGTQGHQALDRLARQRASGHQALDHLARQRASVTRHDRLDQFIRLGTDIRLGYRHQAG
ncbi:unnamed protein product [Staurois parvus]|uniref:Uncharacterized protein n=1 Tax=Staurois parvus TaxID=386267 RepID=A0ABN9DJ42_9NEOB|nr:unnamed protein product [Staurois parvus]